MMRYGSTTLKSAVGPSPWGYPFGGRPLQDCLLVRTRRQSVNVRDFLRVARAHQPEESLRALMDPLDDAVCCAAKWLKSSAMKLSEKFRRYPKRRPTRPPNRPVRPVLDPIEGPDTRPERHSHPFSDSFLKLSEKGFGQSYGRVFGP